MEYTMTVMLSDVYWRTSRSPDWRNKPLR